MYVLYAQNCGNNRTKMGAWGAKVQTPIRSLLGSWVIAGSKKLS